MSFPVRAITLDLDDTLWPFAPIGARIEHALHDWLGLHSPATAERFPPREMLRLREQVAAGHPELAHDLTAIRRRAIEIALAESGSDPALLEPAFEVFYASRNQVDFYPDSLAGLRRLAARVPLIAVSNGNADLGRIGIDGLFAGQLSAREHGAPKPEPSIFLAACELAGAAPDEVLHVGDNVELDVTGAARAGLRSCWLHRDDHPDGLQAWPHAHVAPDLTFDSLLALADWLDASQPGTAASAA